MNKTLIINKKEAEQLLTYDKCIPKMKDAFISTSQKKAVILQRFFIPNENNTRLAIMSAACNNEKVMGGKVIVFGKAPTSQGIVPLFCTETGRLLAITDAKVMTKVRTASTSAAATDILSRKNSKVLVILGGGNQGRAHAIAISKVRDIKEIYNWSYKKETIENCVKYLKEKLPNIKIEGSENVVNIVKKADIICTTTAGNFEPILKGEWLKDGVHINAVGACNAKRLEVDLDVIKKCNVYTDFTEAAIRDSGDLAIPLAKNDIDLTYIKGEVGQVLLNEIKGRVDENENTLFESVGISIQDLISAKIIYDAALDEKKGVFVEI